jgi:long-chain alkane monooxygenase
VPRNRTVPRGVPDGNTALLDSAQGPARRRTGDERSPPVFRLGWFGNITSPVWNDPFSVNDARTWTDGRYFCDIARAMERGGFDFLMIEDSLMVPDTYGGSAEKELKHAIFSPKLDPAPIAPMLAAATEHLGIVTTLSTTFYHPWHLARLVSTLDHLTRGRIGWNVVTSSEHLAAQNYGLTELPEHDLRYDVADEFLSVVDKLWDSWEPDAIVMDAESGRYADHTKVHTIDHEGKFFRSRGPLNTPRMPQGRPVICQAGGSPRGRRFAAGHADMLLAIPNGVQEMKEYRADVRRLAAEQGRNPDDVKCFFVVSPVLGATEEEAQARKAAIDADRAANVDIQLLHMAGTMEIDFSQFDLDAPLPEDLSTNGHQSQLEIWRRSFGDRTIREAAAAQRIESVPLVGTPDSVAAQMDEIMAEVGGDGFLFYRQPLSRRYVEEITDGLSPALRKRGLVRDGYRHAHFRDNLLDDLTATL